MSPSSEPAIDPRDPRRLREDAPLLDGWLASMAAAEAGQLTSMCTPGHKLRQDLTGAVVAGDTPLYGGLDTIKHADALLGDAESRAARLWGADWCRFSVAGSTHGNQALALAVGAPGQEVIVTRCLHRSMLLGLVLAGLRPVWVLPERDPGTGLPAAVAVQTVRAALAAHPGACAVFLGDPSYVGTTGDLAGHADAAHEAGVPLIVDAAWAAYLGFHPDLPPHAIAAGADGMVTSAHKTLPAATQAALVLARTRFLDRARLDRAFEATHTTSPAGAITASTDAARALLARDGKQLCGRLLHLVATARRQLAAVPGVAVLDGPGVDPAKLVVLLAGAGVDGYAVEAEPDRRRDAGGAGRPGHDRADHHDGRHGGDGSAVRQHAGGHHRAPPRPGAVPGAVPRVVGVAGNGDPAARGVFRAERDRGGRRRRRQDQRGARRAVPAGDTRAGAWRGDHPGRPGGAA